MLLRCLTGALLLVLQASASCKNKPEAVPEKLIVNSRVVKDSTVALIFEMPIYMDMDGHFIEHGSMPVKVKNATCNNIQLACKDTCITTYDSLYTMTVEDLNGVVYEGTARVNTKSYLFERK